MDLHLAPGAKLLDSYRLTRFLGRGGFGEVWASIGPDDVPKAVKIARLNDPNNELALREFDGLRRIRTIHHPNLLAIERFEVVGDALIVVMELADKTLADRCNECLANGEQGIPRGELLGYMREAGQALDFLCEQHNLQHLDVKPDNLFLLNGHLKVADFGLLQAKNSDLPTTLLAFSPNYAPPELFDGRVEATADQYSLAVTYQELLTGVRPYAAPDLRGLIIQHLRGRPDLTLLPASERSIVGRALDREPNRRFDSCGQFVDRIARTASFGPPTVSLPQSSAGAVHLGLPNAADPEFVSHQRTLVRGKVKTEKVGGKTTRPGQAASTCETVPKKRIVETFLAYLPMEIYAHKLRGFIDVFNAEIISCTEEKTLILFASRNWLGRRNKNGLFLQVDACARTPNSGYRIVEAIIWAAGAPISDDQLGNRASLLLRLLRSYLLAAQKNFAFQITPSLRQELIG